MKRIALLLSGIAVALFLFYMIYQTITFSLFETEAKLIKQFNVPSKDYSLRIYAIPSNATALSNIQVRKYSHGVEDIVQSYENWNHLKAYSVSRDTLTLVIDDTMHSIRAEEVKKIKLP